MNQLLRQSGCPGRRKFGNICYESEGEILKHHEGGCGWKQAEEGVGDGDGVMGQLARHVARRAGKGWAGNEARKRLRWSSQGLGDHTGVSFVLFTCTRAVGFHFCFPYFSIRREVRFRQVKHPRHRPTARNPQTQDSHE